MAFSVNGAALATDDRGVVVLWNVTERAHPIRLAALAAAGRGTFSPNGHLLATRTDNGSVILWSLADPHHPERIATLTCGTDPQPMAAVAFSPDGRRLVTASNGGTVKLCNVADPARVATLARAGENANGQIGVSSTLTVAAFSPTGARSPPLWATTWPPSGTSPSPPVPCGPPY